MGWIRVDTSYLPRQRARQAGWLEAGSLGLKGKGKGHARAGLPGNQCDAGRWGPWQSGYNLEQVVARWRYDD